MGWIVLLIWLAAVVGLVVWWQAEQRHKAAWERLHSESDSGPDSAVSAVDFRSSRRLRRRWMWVPWAIGILVGISVWLLLDLRQIYAFTAGLMVGLLGAQVEGFLAANHVAKLERQLADTIDIMIGAVGAGASVGAAMDAAIIESKNPLRPYLEEVAGRIRLGDSPQAVFASIAERIPLETFLLFTSALSVHWEVGGKLSSTLTTVGKTIRDRIEVSRRISSSTAQSQFSTIALIALTYFVALVVYNNGQDQMREFVTSSIGSFFVAGSVLLQAVGIAWMNLISKPKF